MPATLLLWLAACAGDDGTETAVAPDAPDARISESCDGIVGTEAVAWDVYTGVPVADPELPPPLPQGAQYLHPSFPLLGFWYPSGWTVTNEWDTPTTLGVELLRDDEAAAWRYFYATVQGTPTAEDVLIQELSAIGSFFSDTALQPVCRHAASGDPGTGTIATTSARLARSDTQTALVSVTVTPFPGLNSSGVYLRSMTAPTPEFPARVWDTFLAIDWQFLVGDSIDPIDSDGDGWFDELDAFPNDPSRH